MYTYNKFFSLLLEQDTQTRLDWTRKRVEPREHCTSPHYIRSRNNSYVNEGLNLKLYKPRRLLKETALSQREFKHQDQHCFIINAMVSWEVIDKLFEFLHLHRCSPWNFPVFHLACVLLELVKVCIWCPFYGPTVSIKLLISVMVWAWSRRA